ncbi:DUF2975 domain-containing protein [Isoptericola halotolerans]|uniref:Small-conductance mechanosensitive channel n=1 Tax=Isoptericola halotolerans TaxID=300560 RepID=A0ABX1ZY46_9MICO|nr:DUF2975 domain-containing protein [Isoptericola halotolerans]NOV95528.1 small-conductance mechanosensitive channel [Isoptericola halotolerans]
MSRTSRLVVPLRVLLAAVLATLVTTQVAALPAILGRTAEQNPDLAPYRWPLLALAVVVLACVQVVLVCTWRLLTMVRDDEIFSERSRRWVDAILAAVGLAWVLVLVACALVAAAEGLSGTAALLLVALLVGAAVGLLMVVLRALLVQATALRTDLDGVI